MQKTSSYSYSKKNIIQDEVFEQEKNEHKNSSISDKLFYFKKSVKDYCLFAKNKFRIDWKQAGHKTANFLLMLNPIMKVFPIVLILFSLTELGLFVSKNIMPLNTHYQWGWNDVFISNLPAIFQPTKQWFAQFLLIAFCFIYGTCAIKWNFSAKTLMVAIYNFIACVFILFSMTNPKFIYDISTYVFTSQIFLRHFLTGKESEDMFNPITYLYYHWNAEDDEFETSHFIIELQDLYTNIIDTSCRACFLTFLFLCCWLIGYLIYEPADKLNYSIISFLVASILILYFVKKRFYIEPTDVCPKCFENRAVQAVELISKTPFGKDDVFTYYECMSKNTCKFCGYSYKKEYVIKDVE